MNALACEGFEDRGTPLPATRMKGVLAWAGRGTPSRAAVEVSSLGASMSVSVGKYTRHQVAMHSIRAIAHHIVCLHSGAIEKVANTGYAGGWVELPY